MYLLPRPEAPFNRISPEDGICMPRPTNQRILNYTTGPMLCVKRGSRVVLRYQENGHVSLSNNTPGKTSSGTVFVYGTAEGRSNDRFLDIHGKWGSKGTSGDRRGRLLVEAPFDDGQCYQAPNRFNEVYKARRARYPPDPYHGENRWCRTYLTIPSDPHILMWTLYWVWDWPTQASVTRPQGRQQIYTTCMDVCMLD